MENCKPKAENDKEKRYTSLNGFNYPLIEVKN